MKEHVCGLFMQCRSVCERVHEVKSCCLSYKVKNHVSFLGHVGHRQGIGLNMHEMCSFVQGHPPSVYYHVGRH